MVAGHRPHARSVHTTNASDRPAVAAPHAVHVASPWRSPSVTFGGDSASTEPIRRKRMNVRASRLLLGSAACLLLGCATPIEVKTASRSQTELVAALGEAVNTLSAAVEDFHRAKQARIREEGRMVVARQAIDAALPPDVKRSVTADALFADYKKSIQPWIDNALSGPDIDGEIAAVEKRIAAIPAAPPSAIRAALEARLDHLRLQKAQLSQPPRPVKDAQA